MKTQVRQSPGGSNSAVQFNSFSADSTNSFSGQPFLYRDVTLRRESSMVGYGAGTVGIVLPGLLIFVLLAMGAGRLFRPGRF